MTNPKRKGILSGVTRSALAAALTKIRPGDRVGYEGKQGKVERVTERFIAIRHDLGYVFTVLAKDLLEKPIEINGQRLMLSVIERKEEEPVELLTEYEIVDRQVDEGVKPILPEPEAEVETEVQTEPESPAAPALCIPEGATWRDLLTRDEYLELKLAGKTDGWVMEVYGAKGPEFAKWKNEQGLKGVKLNPNGTLHFPEELQAEPIAVPSFPDHDCNCGGTCGDRCQCAGRSDIEQLADQHMDQIEQELDEASYQAEAESEEWPLTFAQASKLAADLQEDIECCVQLIHYSALAERVYLAVDKIQKDASARLEQIQNARVVL